MSETGFPDPLQHRLRAVLRLFLAAGQVELRLVPIAGNMLTIGRRPYNDIQLDDLTVSGEHALIRVRGQTVVVHDLGSRNGTLVNGLPIQQRTLVDGDVIDVGIYRLRFELSFDGLAGLSDGLADLAHAGIPDTGFTPGLAGIAGLMAGPGVAGGFPGFGPGTGARDGQPAGNPLAEPPAEPIRLAHVVYLNGPQSGQIQQLDRAICRLGGPAGQVAVVSRRKAGHFITHLEGLAFPLVNGAPIGLTAHRLADGDLIELAGMMLRFRIGA